MTPNQPDHLPFLHRHREKVHNKLHEWLGDKWSQRLVSFALFWELVIKGFLTNRCPVRATALAYTTLLALIPMLAVVASVTTAALKSQGREHIDDAVEYLVSQIIPKLTDEASDSGTNNTDQADIELAEPASDETVSTNSNKRFQISGELKKNAAQELEKSKKDIVDFINESLNKIESGSLGVTGMIGLIAVAILLFSTIESTFNDIWGVRRGRSWVARIVQYWATVTLGPLIPFAVLSLGLGSRLSVEGFWLSQFISETLVPLLILSVGFSFFYQLMPNTRVHWKAALVGGVAAGLLWHLNSTLSFLFLQKSVSFANMYGGLAIVPIFLFGLYISWLILLFGAQVAYAFQNRVAYLQEKEAQQINILGREYMALRIMAMVGENFSRPDAQPPNVIEISQRLRVSTKLVKDILAALAEYGVVMETSGEDPGYTLTRPATDISCHDILMAVRTHGGDVALSSSDYAKKVVDDLFLQVIDAEKSVSRNQSLADLAGALDKPESAPASPQHGATTFLRST